MYYACFTQGLQIATFDIPVKRKFFSKINESNSGYLTFKEFCFMMCMLLDKTQTGGILKQIRKFDYLNVLAEDGPVKVPMAPSIYVEKLKKKKEKKELLNRIAEQKKKEEKEAAKNFAKKRRSKKNRRIHYTVSSASQDESKGQDEDGEGDIDIGPYVATNYEDEELDELRALAPPKVSCCLAFLHRLPLCSLYVDNFLEAFQSSRQGGPHGCFCLCGCRGFEMT